ncbi:hypothetical protein Trco_007881 [Trichoderma cornu-damae]|uniref:Rieske domain-containing protein n=1 Tax=Trichoderma cornu-damae TaxID=654480 RepID=A0A9P8QGB7_9HYPO|nr:hypothetical protein Trco_007881 [Trichoderma cornu-damae]
MDPFWATSRRGTEWFSAGLASSFPNLGFDDENLAKYRACNADPTPGCKIFQVPREDGSQKEEVVIREDGSLERSDMKGLKDQVLVFQYKGKFHAVDHGVPFDIEDFGVVFSAGLSCPKHGWSFDIFTGNADRGNYQLGIWETQLREMGSSNSQEADNGIVSDVVQKEVWVRRKQQRMG